MTARPGRIKAAFACGFSPATRIRWWPRPRRSPMRSARIVALLRAGSRWKRSGRRRAALSRRRALAGRREPDAADRAARRDRCSALSSFALMLAVWVAITGSGLWPPLVEPDVPALAGDGRARPSSSSSQTGYQGQTLAAPFPDQPDALRPRVRRLHRRRRPGRPADGHAQRRARRARSADRDHAADPQARAAAAVHHLVRHRRAVEDDRHHRRAVPDDLDLARCRRCARSACARSRRRSRSARREDDLPPRAAAGEPARHLHRDPRVGRHRRHDAGRRRDGGDQRRHRLDGAHGRGLRADRRRARRRADDGGARLRRSTRCSALLERRVVHWAGRE